jgi:hypothetical protein
MLDPGYVQVELREMQDREESTRIGPLWVIDPRYLCGFGGVGFLMAVKSSTKGSSGKRELIDTGKDKRYVRRDPAGKFKESDDVSRSLSADRRKKAKLFSVL